jgi:putative Ca2+/H+ antiporter (TMEM165/GDT1 family)
MALRFRRPGGKRDAVGFAACPAPDLSMEAFLTSSLLVAVAEIGDKTQLLAIVLATRFRRPLPIILGILAATLANHALAAFAGQFAAGLIEGQGFRIAIAASFVAMGLWTLVPDTLDADEQPRPHGGVFLTTLVAFFLVEMGDKTQLATVALGAQYTHLVAVTAGTTLGMMLANVPAVLLGQALVRRISLRAVRLVAAGCFVAVGAWLAADALGYTG